MLTSWSGGVTEGAVSIADGLYDGLFGDYKKEGHGHGKEEYKTKREANPQLVDSLLSGLSNTVDGLLGGGRGYDHDDDRYDGPEVVVVTPSAGPPAGYQWKA